MDADIEEFLEWVNSEDGRNWKERVSSIESSEVRMTLLLVAWIFGNQYGSDVEYMINLADRLEHENFKW